MTTSRLLLASVCSLVDASIAGGLLGLLLVRGGERMDLIEVHAFAFGAKLESKAERFAVSGREHLLAFHFLAGLVGDDGDDGLALESDSGDVGPDDRREPTRNWSG